LLSRQTEASEHYRGQHIANEVHVVFESPKRLEITGKVTTAVRVMPTVTCGARARSEPSKAFRAQRILAGNISKTGPPESRGSNHVADCWDEQYLLCLRVVLHRSVGNLLKHLVESFTGRRQRTKPRVPSAAKKFLASGKIAC
jgi:hypothetical protein